MCSRHRPLEGADSGTFDPELQVHWEPEEGLDVDQLQADGAQETYPIPAVDTRSVPQLRTAAGQVLLATFSGDGDAASAMQKLILAIEAEADELAYCKSQEGEGTDWHYCDLDSPHHMAANRAEAAATSGPEALPDPAALDLWRRFLDLNDISGGEYAAKYRGGDRATTYGGEIDIISEQARQLLAATPPRSTTAPQVDALREALERIIRTAQEVAIYQHGEPIAVLDVVIQQARAALAAFPSGSYEPEPGQLHRDGWHYPACWQAWAAAWYPDDWPCICENRGSYEPEAADSEERP